MKTIDFSYFIERYNAGEMDEAEKQWFMKELDGNEKLRMETQLRNKTDVILKNQDIMNLRNKLASIEKMRTEVGQPKKQHKHNNFKYAALIAGFIVIGGLALLSNRQMTTDQIIDRYYKPYELATSSRSGSDAALNNDFNTGIEYFKIHDYRNASIYFTKVIKIDPANMHSELLNGISNFEIQNYPEAKGSFIKVVEDNNNFYLDHAQWYLALCYLRTDEVQKAIDQLAIISKSKTIYAKDAKKVLKSLN